MKKIRISIEYFIRKEVVIINKNQCNKCPYYKVVPKLYPSGYGNITVCEKYGKQLYYLYGDRNITPHICKECSDNFSYVKYIDIKE